MILQPGFLDHWKTRLLVALTKDETAPFMVLRLWEHCQMRRKFRFENVSDEALAVIVHSKLEPGFTKSVLLQSGFLTETDGGFHVHDWELTNAFIVSCWKNGTKGGRPKKTHKKPMGFSKETHKKPIQSKPSQSNLVPVSEFPENLRSEQFKQVWAEWVNHRKEIKKPLTPTSVRQQLVMFARIGESKSIEMMQHTIRKGWQGLAEPNGQQPQLKQQKIKLV